MITYALISVIDVFQWIPPFWDVAAPWVDTTMSPLIPILQPNNQPHSRLLDHKLLVQSNHQEYPKR